MYHQLNTWLDQCFRNKNVSRKLKSYEFSLPSILTPAENTQRKDRNFYESDILKSQKQQPCTHKHIMHSKRLV